jgi:hypothetical protein
MAIPNHAFSGPSGRPSVIPGNFSLIHEEKAASEGTIIR